MSDTHWPKVTRENPCRECDTHRRGCTRTADGGNHCHKTGRTWQDQPSENGYQPRPGRAITSVRPKAVYPGADAAIEAAGRFIEGGTLAHVWPYRDAAGVEVMRVARFDLVDGHKEFRPVHPTSAGWCSGDPAGKLPLYLLPDIPDAGPVWVCEGEKATDAAVSIGLAAVTSAHGSSSPEKTDWTPLAGRDVMILPDNDGPGTKYASAVTSILFKLEPAARVKIITLPGLPDGGDMVEYIDGMNGTALDAIRADVERRASGERWIEPSSIIGGPVLTCMADVEAKEIDWLWPGRVPLGRITLLVGKPGEGKSFLTTDMTARVTTGTPWPDGNACPIGSVILISIEDDAGDTIRPRLDAHHADVRKVHLLKMVRRVNPDDGRLNEVMFTLNDLRALEESLKVLPDCRLIVIDPIGSVMGGGTDSHRDNEVRAVLAPVAQLAEKYNVAVLVVMHRRKSAGNSADDMALGSVGFVGIARAVWHLTRDRENKSRRLLLPGKNNLAVEGSGLAFTIGGDPAVLAWERDPVLMSADDQLAAENGDGETPGPEPEARNAAAEWLRALLADGEVDASKVKAEAQAAGLNYRTVQRAADALGIVREKNSFHGGWQWRFPKLGDESDGIGDNGGDKSLRVQEPVHLSPSGNSPENGDFKVTTSEDDKLIYPVAFDAQGTGNGREQGEL